MSDICDLQLLPSLIHLCVVVKLYLVDDPSDHHSDDLENDKNDASNPSYGSSSKIDHPDFGKAQKLLDELSKDFNEVNSFILFEFHIISFNIRLCEL